MIPPTPVLMIWPFFALIFFATLRFERAMVVSLLAGYLFLPDNFGVDLPLLPPLNKVSAISFGLLLGWVIYRPKAKRVTHESYSSVSWILGGCILFVLLSPFLTVLTNPSPIVVGISFRPGLRSWDAVSVVITTMISFVPFFLAKRYLFSKEAHREIVVGLTCFALGYSLLVLLEVRLSPQLNLWFYGYFPHNFTQHMRGGGFRPIVFLNHGLWLGFFLSTAVIAAFALSKDALKLHARLFWCLAGLWLLAVLVLSRNAGAAALGVFFLIMVVFTGRRLQMLLALAIGSVFLAYPLVHQLEYLPTRAIVTYLEQSAPDRAQSLAFRLNNEDRLMMRAQEKAIWGWGGFGRNRVLDESGRDLTVVDGGWIGRFSTSGWFGYLSYFGVLCVSLLALPFVSRSKRVGLPTLCLVASVAANLIYLIPNDTLSPIGWTFAGALAGYCTRREDAQKLEGPKTKDNLQRANYTRFPTTSKVSDSHSLSLVDPSTRYVQNRHRPLNKENS